MSRRLWLVAGLVFGLTLLANLPAALVLRWVPWPAGWQPQDVSGTLWQGQVQRLGMLGPLNWQLRPWRGEAELLAGFQQQAWRLTASGWPWAWQVQLQPASARPASASDYLLDGQWQGHVQLRGSGTRCQQAEGSLNGQELALLAPWTLVLGHAQLSLQCQQGLQVLAAIQRPQQHQLNARFESRTGTLTLDGQVQPEAAMTPLLVQANWLKAGASQFKVVLGGG